MNEKLTAYALNELPPDERAELEAQMKDDPKLREEAEAMKAFCAMLETEVGPSAEDTLDPEQRSKLVQTFQSTETKAKIIRPPFWRRPIFFNGVGLAAAACVALMFAAREIREASQQAKLDQFHGAFAYKVDRSEPAPTSKVKRVTTSPEPDAVVMTPDMASPPARKIPSSAAPSPVPAAPPLVGSGPLAPTNPIKLKEDQNGLWFDSKDKYANPESPKVISPGTGGTGSSVTASNATTVSTGRAQPTLAANSASAPVESKKQRKFVAQTANPAVDVNGNPPASPIGQVTGKEYTAGTTIVNGATLDLDSSVASTDATGAAKKINPVGPPTNAGSSLVTSGGIVTSSKSRVPAKPASKKELEDALRADPVNTADRRDIQAIDQQRTKMLNQVNSGWEDQPPVATGKVAAAPAGVPIAGGRAGNGAISSDSIDGMVASKSLVASADTAKKDVPSKALDALEQKNAELKKQIEEMSTHSYQLSAQEAQHHVLEEKILRDRLATERLQRERRQQQYFAEQQQHSRNGYNTATYRPIVENPFTFASQEPLSTFSTDVDTASYANARRFLNANQRPPGDSIRLEELINYFPYAYPAPEDDKPLAVKVDIGEAPWQPLHRLARIAIKARDVKNAERPAANFTFLLDVSGSMSPAERLPLVKKALHLLVDQLREDDRVSIVTYAGESGLALESTAGNEKEKIREAIDRLNAEGSTNGAGGIRMAYEQAVSHFKKDGINRIILCTDGDFNVGTSNVEELKALITEKAKTGVYLSVLGVGSDNLHDFTMQTLADCGNGNYHYLDSMSEARKVLVEQMTGNMITVAKDVKIQVEFNPAQVAAYRLIGYEKRMLEKEDFNNDKKDAGDIGAGHTITALYEIVPADLKYPDGKPLVDDLKYNKGAAAAAAAPEGSAKEEAPAANKEIMTVKLRYKEPNQDKSKLMVLPVTDTQKKLSENDRDFQFATSVAGFGMLLRGSPYGNDLTWDTVRQLALSGKGDDEQGWRGEFIQLIEKARGICAEVR